MKHSAAIAPLFLLSTITSLVPSPVAAQISAAPDGTNTLVNSAGNTFNITGGTQAGANLFHSFQQFGLNQGQIATFLSNPAIANILGRVTGGDASVINGLVQVTGSNANLYLMNPAGIVFGANASLNVPAAFTATTANGIGVGNGWFNATGANNYANLIGTPNGFAFTAAQPGAIANAGNLAVGQGQDLTLLGGTVVSTGSLAAPGGTVTVVAVPGERLVRVSQPGSLLSLEFQPLSAGMSSPATAAPTLPQLLTGGNLNSATGLTVENGTVKLVGSGIAIAPGDVTARNVTAQTATLSANNNLTLVESQLQTTGDLNLLAKNTVTVRDSVAVPVVVQTGRDLTIQGDQGIDILALNHRQNGKPFQAGRDLNLVSDGVISGDAHFGSGGNFSTRSLNGNPATFISLNDPVISSNGNVTFLGSYTGASLKVEAIGNIRFTGNVTINNPDPGAIDANAADQALLQSDRALILRAGRTTLDNPNNVPNGAFINPGGTTTPGSIQVDGDITGGGGPVTVVMSATGSIATQGISNANAITADTPGSIYARSVSGSSVRLTSTAGTVTLGSSADADVDNFGGTFIISATNGILANGRITGGRIELSSSAGDIIVNTVRGGSAGVDINAAGLFQARGGTELFNVFLRTRAADNPEVNAFLQSKGINLPPDQIVTVHFEFGNADESLPIIYSVGASQSDSAPAGSLNAPITIRFGGATRTLIDSSFPIVATDGTGTITQGRILVQGGDGAFFLGPTTTGRLVPTNSDLFLTKDVGGNFIPVTAANYTPGTILYRNETYTAAFPTANFPATSSGVAGSIYVGFGSNQTLYGASQSRVFAPVPPSPPGVPPTPGTPGASGGGSSGSVAQTPGGPQVSSTTGEVVQRSLDRSGQANACDTVAIAPGSRTDSRSGGETRVNPCTPVSDEAQILKILGDDGQPKP